MNQYERNNLIDRLKKMEARMKSGDPNDAEFMFKSVEELRQILYATIITTPAMCALCHCKPVADLDEIYCPKCGKGHSRKCAEFNRIYGNE